MALNMSSSPDGAFPLHLLFQMIDFERSGHNSRKGVVGRPIRLLTAMHMFEKKSAYRS